MAEEKTQNYSEIFKDLMGEDSTYEFFLKMQNIMPKFTRKMKDPEFFSFITFIVEHLLKYEENESISTLVDLSMKLYIKHHPEDKIEDPMLFMNSYHKIYKMLPVKIDKSYFKYKFLELCEKNGISEDVIHKEKIYYEFAIDSKENKFLIEGYRFAIKSMNLEAINSVVQGIFENTILKMTDKEKPIFISRTCLEILINKNIQMAMDFVIPYIDAKNNYEGNDPLLNMSYFICLLLNDKNITFDKFKEIVLLYKPIIEGKDASLKKYINKISTDNFKQPVFVEVNNPFGGFNFMNMLRLVTSLAGGGH
jgi:hypothetical protein